VALSGRWVSKDDEKWRIELEKYEKMMTNPEDLYRLVPMGNCLFLVVIELAK